MANRDITVRVKAEIGAFKRDMAEAAAAAKKAADESKRSGKAAESGIGGLAQSAKTHEKAWNQVSTGLVAGGVAVTAALGLAGKEAISWESSWAGVMKTNEGTSKQTQQLEKDLRQMAKTLPSTHTEIAAVAEAAGQLGVGIDDVASFSKVMIDLGETTNLGAEEAATGLARFSNVMGTSFSDADRLGSAIVGLGNNFATTEAEIMDMAQRIAPVGRAMRMAEPDVLAMATAMSSVGIRAEAGGTAIGTVMKRIDADVRAGGDSLIGWADAAGVSATQFASAWRKRPAEAMQILSEGLGKTAEAGGDVVSILSDLGVKGERESSTMLSLASASDQLARALDVGATAWEENTALLAEAEIRYQTTEAKISMAWNKIKDAAITAGGAIAPVLGGIADSVGWLAEDFAKIPEPAQNALTAMAGIAGVGALAAGGLMKIVSWLPGTVAGLQALGVDTPKATRAVGIFGKTIGGITAVGAGLIIGKQAIEAINEAVRSGKPQVEEYFNLLTTGGGKDVIDAMKLDLGAGGASGFMFPRAYIDSVKDYYGAHSEGAAAAKQALDVGGHGGLVGWFNRNMSTGDVRRASEDWLQMAEAGKAVARAFEMGQNDLGIEALKSIQTELEFSNEDIARLINQVPELRGALTQIATDGGIKLDPNDELGLANIALGRIKVSAPEAGDALGNLGAGADGAAAGLDGIGDAAMTAAEKLEAVAERYDAFYQLLVATGMVVLGEREAFRALEESIDAADEALKKNGKTLDDSTEKGRANGRALDDLAVKTMKAMEAQRENGASTAEMAGTLAKGREEFIKYAEKMGMSTKEAKKLADQLNLIPGAVYVNFDSNTDDLAGKLQEIHELVQSTPDGSITISENSPAVVEALRALGYIVTELPDGKIKVSETGTDETGKKIDKTAGKKRTAKINAEAITGAAERALNNTARHRTSSITQTVTTNYKTTGTRAVEGVIYGQYAKKHGGRAPGYAAGGRVPHTGLGTDKVMGVNQDGIPHVRVDDREWIINRKSSDKHDALLNAINRDDPRIAELSSLVGFASGGRAGWARDQRDRARAALQAARRTGNDKRIQKAEKAFDDAQSRYERLRDLEFDVRRDVVRGNTTSSFVTGSGMSVVDDMFGQSKNTDLSQSQRSKLRSLAYSTERQLLKLEKQADSLKTKIEEATDARDRLLDAQERTASSLRGEWSIQSVMQWDTLKNGPLTAGDVLSQARTKAGQYQAFAKKINDLRKRGYSAAVIEDIISLGVNEGTLAADALLAGSDKEVSGINRAYKDMDQYTMQAGNNLTKAMEKGGIDAAEGLLRGLESQQKRVDSAFYNLGKQAENAFKRALGIKSPSTVFADAADDTIDGAVAGQERSKGKLFRAYAELGYGVVEAYQAAQSRNFAQAIDPGPALSTNARGTANIGPNVSVTVYHPVAEPTSRTIEKSSSYLQL